VLTVYVYSYIYLRQASGRYDALVPNKTIYVSDGDLSIFQRAQELAGGNLSAAIATALRRYVDAEEARTAGFDQVTVRVGVGAGRKVRFSANLVGEWADTIDARTERIRVWRGRKGRYVLHIEREPQYWAVDAEGKPAGWRGYLGVGNVRYGGAPKESTLEVIDTLAELRERIPPELYDMVARSAKQPAIEDLDI
jgi:EXLDI family protein